MIAIPAAILGTAFAILAMIHFYWALGGRRGLRAVIPTRDGTPVLDPGGGATAGVALVLLAAAFVPAWRWVAPGFGPAWMPRAGAWAIAAVMAGRTIGDFRYCGFFKRVRGTVFSRYDTRLFSPLCAALAVCAIWLAAAY